MSTHSPGSTRRPSTPSKPSRETMSLELQEFGVEVATINPGPFLTGFNDRGFETWKSWEDEPPKGSSTTQNWRSRVRSSIPSRCTPP